jgi:hypothetical protein
MHVKSGTNGMISASIVRLYFGEASLLYILVPRPRKTRLSSAQDYVRTMVVDKLFVTSETCTISILLS